MARTWMLAALSIAVVGCSSRESVDVPADGGCERAACEATAAPAQRPPIQQGIAGAVSYTSDVVVNGCAECTWSRATLDVWATPALVSDTAAAEATIAAGPPALVVDASERYAQALQPGAYLVCALGGQQPGPCGAIEVRAGQVTTVNVRNVYGPPTLKLFAADGREDTAHVFAVRATPPRTSVRLSDGAYFAGGEPARFDVREPAAGRGGLAINFQARAGDRSLSFLLEQPTAWPPQETFELLFPPGGGPASQIGDSQGGRHLVSRTGRVRLTVEPGMRFSGTFEIAQSASASGEPTDMLRGTFAGGWVLTCAVAAGPSSWQVDGTAPFCVDIARQAGVTPPPR